MVKVYVNFKDVNNGVDDFQCVGCHTTMTKAINYAKNKYNHLYKKGYFKFEEI